MQFIKVKTRVFCPPKDNIYKLLDQHLPKLKEGDVLFITSKILAIHQGRCVKITNEKTRQQIIKKEADWLLPEKLKKTYHSKLTIKESVILSNAGIDQSNGNGYHILWPKHVNQELKNIWQYLTTQHHLKRLGIIATDSRPSPLRLGVTGVAIGAFGLKPLIDCRGQKDVFGRKLKATKVNVLDSLAATAVLLMGEGGESTPLVISRGTKRVSFTDRLSFNQLLVPIKEDRFYPLLKTFKKNS